MTAPEMVHEGVFVVASALGGYAGQRWNGARIRAEVSRAASELRERVSGLERAVFGAPKVLEGGKQDA